MSSTSDEQESFTAADFLIQTAYVQVAVFSLTVYDYLTNFDLEVEFIWGKKYSWTTLAYVAMRYLGLIFTLLQTIMYINVQLPGLTCFRLFVPYELIVLVSTFLLQVMMAVRVYALLDRSKVVLFTLGVCFLVVKILDITVIIISIRPEYFSDATLFNLSSCYEYLPPNRTWVFPVSSVSVLVLDTILCAFAVYHAVKHLPTSFWRAPAHAAISLTSVIVHDNLIYYFFVVVSMLLSALTLVPFLSASLVYNCIQLVPQTMLVAMVGPWMIISLRRSYEGSTGAGASRSHELTSVSFAVVLPEDSDVEA